MPVIKVDGVVDYEVADAGRTCWRPACRTASTCPTSAGTRPWARSAPAGSAPWCSTRTRTTPAGRIVMACMTPVSDGARISIEAPHARSSALRSSNG